MNFVDRYAPLCLTAGLVVWLEGLITVEWTYPYCLDRSDGPAYAAQGMPLPYWMWNGVSSLEHDFVPHIYVLNIVLLSLLFFPLAWWIWHHLFRQRPAWISTVLGSAGALLLVSHIALTMFMVLMGWFQPTTSLSPYGSDSYSEFRPVRIGLYRSNAPNCTPSQFWFPNGWQPRQY